MGWPASPVHLRWRALSPLWVLPVVVIATGFAALAVAARGLATAARSAADAVDDLHVLGAEATAVRDEADAVLRHGLALLDARSRASIPTQADQ